MSVSFKKIIIRIKEALNLNADGDVAKALGISVNVLSNRKRSGSIPYTELVQLAEIKNINLNWLISGSGSIYKDEVPESEIQPISDNEPRRIESHPEQIVRDGYSIHIPQCPHPQFSSELYHYVPKAEATLSAGGGAFVLSESTNGEFYAFRKSFLSKIATSPKNTILMQVSGDSMEPKISNDDTVMIDVGRRSVRSGIIYALGFDDCIVIKEIEVLPGGKALIVSKNRKAYPAYEIDIKKIRIIGQVIWSSHTFIKR